MTNSVVTKFCRLRQVHLHAAHDRRVWRQPESPRGCASASAMQSAVWQPQWSAVDILQTCCMYFVLHQSLLTMWVCAMAGGNPDSNTLLSDMATVICLDDYHCLDRYAHSWRHLLALAAKDDPKALHVSVLKSSCQHPTQC